MSSLDDVFKDLPERLEPSDIAERLGMTKQGVYIWLRDGTIPAYKMGNSWFIFKSDLIATLQKGSNQTRKEPDTPKE